MSGHGATVAGLSRWDREIVAKRVGILAGIPAVVSFVAIILGQFGIKIPDVTEQVQSIAAAVITMLGLLAGIWTARSEVTPASPALAPMSSNGVPLVEVTTLAEPPAQPVTEADPADVVAMIQEPTP